MKRNLWRNGCEDYIKKLQKYKDLLEKTNTGFLVILEGVSPVLKNTIEDENFFNNLQWLLPVDFEQSLYSCENGELFKDLTTETENNPPIISFCKITFNDTAIYRPIKKDVLRDYLCKSNFKYAVGFHSFNKNKIVIDRNNIFTVMLDNKNITFIYFSKI